MDNSSTENEAGSGHGSSQAASSEKRQRWDGWCERLVLGLVLAILGFSLLATGAVRPIDFAVIEWLTVTLLGVWLCRFLINPKHRLLWPWLCWPVLGFVLYAAGRYYTADIEYVARQELARVVVYAVVFFVVLNNLHRLETTQIVAMALLGAGTLLSMCAVGQYMTGAQKIWAFPRPEIYLGRGSGTFINPSNLAGFLEMLFPMALAYTLASRLKDLSKVLTGYATLMIFAGLIVTFSRAAWVATAISLVVLCVRMMRQRDYRLQTSLVVGGLVLVILCFMSVLRPDQRLHPLAQAVKVERIRPQIWAPALRIWSDHPVLGVGPGHFDYYFRQYRPATPELQVRPYRVHNDFLNAFVDYGIIGGVLLLGIWGLFYGEVFRSWRYVRRRPNDLRARGGNKSSLMLGGTLGLVAIFLHSAVDFNLQVPAVALVAATLMGLLSGHFRFATEKHWHTVRLPLRIPVFLCLLAALGFLSAQAWRLTRESMALASAERHPPLSDNRLADLTRAWEVDPRNPETAYQIGELYRLRSWEGRDSYRQAAKDAIQWFERAAALNPLSPHALLRHGMCLHWLGEHAKAAPFFERALALDPNGYYTIAMVGWHHVQQNNWPEAQKLFNRSLALNRDNNPIARTYLDLAEKRPAEVR